jgi:uncharacterized protein
MQVSIPGFEDALILNKSANYEPWRFVSAIFLHGGIGHLFYNMFALALFGFMAEQIVGTKKFLAVFFISGIIANFISYFFYTSSLGASGAIFGVIGLLIMLRPKMTVWAFGMPLPLFLAGILWIGGDLIGALAFLSGNPISNTGNIAHLSGVIIGILYGFKLRKDYAERPIQRQRVYLDEQGMRDWEERHMR